MTYYGTNELLDLSLPHFSMHCVHSLWIRWDTERRIFFPDLLWLEHEPTKSTAPLKKRKKIITALYKLESFLAGFCDSQQPPVADSLMCIFLLYFYQHAKCLAIQDYLYNVHILICINLILYIVQFTNACLGFISTVTGHLTGLKQTMIIMRNILICKTVSLLSVPPYYFHILKFNRSQSCLY